MPVSAQANFRGRMIVINVLFITFGQVLAYGIGAGLEHVPHIGWRLMVGIGGIPAGVQLVSMYWLPESPRYLVRKHRNSEAREVLATVYKNESADELDRKVAYLEEWVNMDLRKRVGGEGQSKWRVWRRGARELFTVGRNRRALVISCGLQGIQVGY